jgi:CRP-like cAMP-binding protein
MPFTLAMLEMLSEGDRREIEAACVTQNFQAGAFVFHAGAPADALHTIIEGHFAVRTPGPDGSATMIAVLGPGDTFGEVGLVAQDRRRTAAISSLDGGRTLVLSHERFQAICHARPQLRRVVEQLLADHVARLTKLLIEALYADADTRVLRRLATLANTYGHNGAEVMLTQDELGQLSGASRATVNRVLREQEARGTIRLGRGSVRVLDIAALLEAKQPPPR